jgi:hypothetical protein
LLCFPIRAAVPAPPASVAAAIPAARAPRPAPGRRSIGIGSLSCFPIRAAPPAATAPRCKRPCPCFSIGAACAFPPPTPAPPSAAARRAAAAAIPAARAPRPAPGRRAPGSLS